MYRSFLLVALCLFWNSANESWTAEPFANKTAREAQQVYEAEVAKAKADYAAKLEIAIKEAGGAGNLEEANRIAALKKEIESGEDDPVEKSRKALEGTRWGPNPQSTLKLYPDRKVVFAGGHSGTWILSDPQTLLLQSEKSANINVWKFDEKLKSARVYMFTQFKKDDEIVYKKY